MPEGPEIRRAADRIAHVLTGRKLEDVWFGLPRLVRFSDELCGCCVQGVDTYGKALLIRFDLGLSLYAHNQLYGVWHVRERGQWPKTRRSLRIALHTASHSALLFSATDISLLTPEEELFHPYLSRLGPDVLDPVLTWRDVSRRLNQPRFHNRALGSLYLDQGFLAGIGNYLRSEILFAAGLHPSCKPRELAVKNLDISAQDAQRIYGTAPEVSHGEVLVTELDKSFLRGLYTDRYQSMSGEPKSVGGMDLGRSP